MVDGNVVYLKLGILLLYFLFQQMVMLSFILHICMLTCFSCLQRLASDNGVMYVFTRGDGVRLLLCSDNEGGLSGSSGKSVAIYRSSGVYFIMGIILLLSYEDV